MSESRWCWRTWRTGECRKEKSSQILLVPIIFYTHFSGLAPTHSLAPRDLSSSHLHRWVLATQCGILLCNRIWPFHRRVAPQGPQWGQGLVVWGFVHTHQQTTTASNAISSVACIGSIKTQTGGWTKNPQNHQSALVSLNSPSLTPYSLPHTMPEGAMCERSMATGWKAGWGSSGANTMRGWG